MLALMCNKIPLKMLPLSNKIPLKMLLLSNNDIINHVVRTCGTDSFEYVDDEYIIKAVRRYQQLPLDNLHLRHIMMIYGKAKIDEAISEAARNFQ